MDKGEVGDEEIGGLILAGYISMDAVKKAPSNKRCLDGKSSLHASIPCRHASI